MKSDFDQMADSRAQRKAERALDEASEQAIDTARQALFRVQRDPSQHRPVCLLEDTQWFLAGGDRGVRGLLLAALSPEP